MRRPFSIISAFALVLFLAACDTAEERAEEHYQNALSLLEEGDTERALVELRNVFQLVPIHQEARYAMARIFYEDTNNMRAAFREYLRIAEQSPDDLEPQIRLAEIAFSQGDFEVLARHGERAIEIAPDDPDTQVIKSLMDYQNAVAEEDRAAQQAIATAAEELLEANPEAVVLREVLLDNALREPRLSEALALLDIMTEANPNKSRLWNQRLQVLIQIGDDVAIEQQLIKLVELNPDDIEQKTLLVRYYQSRGELDKTEAFLRSLVEDAPADDIARRTDLIRFLAEFRGSDAARTEIAAAIDTATDPLPFAVIGAGFDFDEGQQDRAIMDLEAAIEASESDEHVSAAKVTLAQMLVAVGNDVGARALVEETLENDPSNSAALRMSARWSINSDDPDSAIADLRVALDQNPEDVAALSLMSQAYSRTGSDDLARDFLALAAEASGNAPAETIRYAQVLISEERYLPAEDVLLAALRLAPTNLALLRTAGDLYLGLDDQGRARQVAETLRRLETPEAINAAVQIEAEILNRTEGFDSALEFLQNLADQDQGDAGAQLLALRALLSSGDTEAALSVAEDLVEANPDSPTIQLVLATTVAATDDIDRAISLFENLIADYPEESRLYLQLSELQRRAGERDAAQATIESGIERLPEDPNLLWALASGYEEGGNFDGAIEIYEALYSSLNEQGRNNVVVANNLASMLATYRDDEASLERAYAIARRFRTTDIPAIQDTYGWIAHRRGDSEEALPYLLDASAALSDDPIVQYHLAEVLNATGDTEAALAKYREVVSLSGAGDTRPQIQAAQARIVELEQSQQETE